MKALESAVNKLYEDSGENGKVFEKLKSKDVMPLTSLVFTNCNIDLSKWNMKFWNLKVLRFPKCNLTTTNDILRICEENPKLIRLDLSKN